MQSRGIDFLCPIWQLITKKREGYDYYRNKPEFQGLDLSDGQVVTFYTTFVNDYKRPLHQNEISIRDAVRKRLTPGIKWFSQRLKLACSILSKLNFKWEVFSSTERLMRWSLIQLKMANSSLKIQTRTTHSLELLLIIPIRQTSFIFCKLSWNAIFVGKLCYATSF